MAVGKNKKLGKKMKAGKKKAADPFTRKEWYDWKAPSMYTNRIGGKTPVTRTTGTKVASDSLKGRIFTTSLADLQVRQRPSSSTRHLPLPPPSTCPPSGARARGSLRRAPRTWTSAR